VISRLNFGADLARGSLAAGSNIGEAFQRRPRSRTRSLVDIDNVDPIIGDVEGKEVRPIDAVRKAFNFGGKIIISIILFLVIGENEGK
jgi:hypothetical protein